MTTHTSSLNRQNTDLAIFWNLFLPCTLLSDCLAWRHFIHGSSWYSKEGLKWYTSISYIGPDKTML